MIRVLRKDACTPAQLLQRKSPMRSVEEPVREILEKVRQEGDVALLDYTAAFDGVRLEALRVSETEMQAAIDAVDPALLAVMKTAAENIRGFHACQIRTGFLQNKRRGVVMGQKVMPLERVGLYVPGGKAAYPSTVLMNAIPAKLAGCPSLVMVTPPRKDGSVEPAILAAAQLAGVDEIYKIGGAQAIAALAYGTESILPVDKIVGPGNAFVAEAKRQVYGRVAIDMIAGPSEILIVADGKSDPRILAADLLSQAEHDEQASAVLITDDAPLALAVQQAIEDQLAQLPREAIARKSVEENGKILVVDSIAEAIEYANRLAPEHLELCVDEPFAWLDLVRHAGSVFLGRDCPEALGDYLAGPNHTLPTSGAARFSSPLSVDDFVKKTQYTYFTREALAAVAQDVACFAEAEGLHAHARSALIRTEDGL